MRRDCADLTEVVVKSGHWMAQEKPVDVNAALANWLATKLPDYWKAIAFLPDAKRRGGAPLIAGRRGHEHQCASSLPLRPRLRGHSAFAGSAKGRNYVSLQPPPLGEGLLRPLAARDVQAIDAAALRDLVGGELLEAMASAAASPPRRPAPPGSQPGCRGRGRPSPAPDAGRAARGAPRPSRRWRRRSAAGARSATSTLPARQASRSARRCPQTDRPPAGTWSRPLSRAAPRRR